MANRESYKVPINKQHFFRCLKLHGFTEAKIAEAIGVSSKTIQRAVITGKINPHYLEQMASIMHEDPNYISGIGEVKQEPCDTNNEVGVNFPETWEEYEQYYGFNDTEEVYSNNIRLIPSFRVKQWLEHINTRQKSEEKTGDEWVDDVVESMKGETSHTIIPQEEMDALLSSLGDTRFVINNALRCWARQEQIIGRCKDCKYFEYDSVANFPVVQVDEIPLIVAHEICNKWGNGCKTSGNGYCFLFEPQERGCVE